MIRVTIETFNWPPNKNRRIKSFITIRGPKDYNYNILFSKFNPTENKYKTLEIEIPETNIPKSVTRNRKYLFLLKRGVEAVIRNMDKIDK